MTNGHSGDWIAALDLERIRRAFRRSVVEQRMIEREGRQRQRMLAREPEPDEADPEGANWVVIDWVKPN